MEDGQIVSLYWQRSESAITATQQKYGSYLLTIARNILSDPEDSEESVNDTYLAAWNSMPPHKPQVLRTYLGKLTRRISIDCFRRRNREKRQASEYALSLSELEECLAGGTMPEEMLEEQALADAISRYLRTLPERARNSFIGRYYFLDSLGEVARYCGMSESAAKSLLLRTRRGLREFLQKEGFLL